MAAPFFAPWLKAKACLPVEQNVCMTVCVLTQNKSKASLELYRQGSLIRKAGSPSSSSGHRHRMLMMLCAGSSVETQKTEGKRNRKTRVYQFCNPKAFNFQVSPSEMYFSEYRWTSLYRDAVKVLKYSAGTMCLSLFLWMSSFWQ